MDKAEPHTSRAIAASGWPRLLFYVLQFTWGLSVNLAGLLVFLFCRTRSRQERFVNSVVCYLPGNRGGMSLGIFLFISLQNPEEDCALCVHEYGHTIQCLFLGPLYWVLVAVPSFLWFHLCSGLRAARRIPYDALYCERWADQWGKKWSGR